MQVKFIDDSSQAASINLKQSLKPDPEDRARPLAYHERTGMVLKHEDNIVQKELDRFYHFTVDNQFVISRKKCYTMVFSRSKKYAFPPEFTIDGLELLSEEKEATIFGVKVSSTLCWQAQVQFMVSKASKVIWTLRRMKTLGVDTIKLTQFWRTEGRVHLEHQAPLWHSSLTVAQSR